MKLFAIVVHLDIFKDLLFHQSLQPLRSVPAFHSRFIIAIAFLAQIANQLVFTQQFLVNR
jgi:hypothetical protein